MWSCTYYHSLTHYTWRRVEAALLRPDPSPQTQIAVVSLRPDPSPQIAVVSLILMDTPPAEDKAKRARKRSRYLDHHYQTPTLLDALHGGGGHHTPPPPPPPPPTDLLAALHQAAACPYDLPGGVDAGALLAFFALHRDSVTASASASAPALHKAKAKAKDTTTSISSSSSSSSSSPRPNPCRAMALAPTHGSAANAHAMEQPTGPANAPPLPPAVGGAAGHSKRAPKNKKPTANSSPKQAQHSGKPVALILHFAADHQPLPTKEQLHSTFRGFGPLIEPNTEVTKKRARVVFQGSAAAEAAYGCVHTLGLGAALAAARLQYLRPPPPAPKIPLTDVRNNLEKMIASLTGPSLLGKGSAWSLAGEMQHLLFKVDRALGAAGAGPSTSAAAHHH